MLIDPFGPEHHSLFVATPAEEIAYPLLFTHVNHPTMSRPADNALLIVDTVDEFKRNLDIFTGGLYSCFTVEGDLTRAMLIATLKYNFKLLACDTGALEGLDWSNVVLAGGSALNCLLAVPPEYEGEEERKKWLGPDWSSENERGVGNAHGRGVKTIERAKSGYGSSDVDLFIVGLSPEAATAKLNTLLRHICERLYDAGEQIRFPQCLNIREARSV